MAILCYDFSKVIYILLIHLFVCLYQYEDISILITSIFQTFFISVLHFYFCISFYFYFLFFIYFYSGLSCLHFYNIYFYQSINRNPRLFEDWITNALNHPIGKEFLTERKKFLFSLISEHGGLFDEYIKKEMNQKVKNQQTAILSSNNKRRITEIKLETKNSEIIQNINIKNKNSSHNINGKKDLSLEFRSKDFSSISASEELWGVALLVENTEDNQSEEFHRWFSRSGADYQALDLPYVREKNNEVNDCIDDVVAETTVKMESVNDVDNENRIENDNENESTNEKEKNKTKKEKEKEKDEKIKKRNRSRKDIIEIVQTDDRDDRNIRKKRRKEESDSADSGPESIGYRVSGTYRNAVDQSTHNSDSSSEESSLKLEYNENEEYGVSDSTVRSVKSRRFLAFNPHHFEQNIDISLQDLHDTVEYCGIKNDQIPCKKAKSTTTDYHSVAPCNTNSNNAGVGVESDANSDKMLLQDYLAAAYSIGLEFIEKGCMLEIPSDRVKETPLPSSSSSSSSSTTAPSSSSSSFSSSSSSSNSSPPLIPHTDPRSAPLAAPPSLCTVLRVLLLSPADSALQQNRNEAAQCMGNSGNIGSDNNNDKNSTTTTATAPTATSTSTSTSTPTPSCDDSGIVSRNIGSIPGADHSHGKLNTANTVSVHGNNNAAAAEEQSVNNTLPLPVIPEKSPCAAVCADGTQSDVITQDTQVQDLHDHPTSTSTSTSTLSASVSGGLTKWVEIFDGKVRRTLLLRSCRQFLVGMERALDALHTHSYAPIQALKCIRADLELRKMKFHISHEGGVVGESDKLTRGELGGWTKRELELFVRAKKRYCIIIVMIIMFDLFILMFYSYFNLFLFLSFFHSFSLFFLFSCCISHFFWYMTFLH